MIRRAAWRWILLVFASAVVTVAAAAQASASANRGGGNRISFSPAAGTNFGGPVSSVQLGVSGTSLSGTQLPKKSTTLTFVTPSGGLVHTLTLAGLKGDLFPTVSVSLPAVQRVYCLEDAVIAGERLTQGTAAPQWAVTVSFVRSATGGGTGGCGSLLDPPALVVLGSSRTQPGVALRVDCLIRKCTGRLDEVLPAATCPRTGATIAAAVDFFLKLDGIPGETPKGKPCGLILTTAHFALAGGTTTYVRPSHRKSRRLGSFNGGIFVVTVLRGQRQPFIQALSNVPAPPKLPPGSSLGISCRVAGAVGTSLRINGNLEPAFPGAGVAVSWTSPGGPTVTDTARTAAGGGYFDQFTPGTPGVWTVRAHWVGGGTYGAADSNVCNFQVAKEGTSLSITAPSSDSIGSPATISGTIGPAVTGASVTLTYTPPSGAITTHTVSTDSNGNYSDSFTPTSSPGTWSVSASWSGDQNHSGASNGTTFTVTKENTSISVNAPPGFSRPGQPATVSGAITPTVAGASVTLTYKPPSGASTTHTVSTGSNGNYSDTITPPVGSAGTWSVSASWGGDQNHNGASNSTTFTVG